MQCVPVRGLFAFLGLWKYEKARFSIIAIEGPLLYDCSCLDRVFILTIHKLPKNHYRDEKNV